MKILLPCVMILMSFLGAAQEKVEWKLVKDIEKGYRINFPSEPESKVEEVKTQKGVVKMYTYTLQPVDFTTDQNLIYMTAFTSYPHSFFESGLTTDESKHTVLDNSVNGAVNNTKGILLSSNKISFNGYLGRNSKIKIGEYIIEMRTVLVEFKLYLIQVIYHQDSEGNSNAARFMDSFELIKVSIE